MHLHTQYIFITECVRCVHYNDTLLTTSGKILHQIKNKKLVLAGDGCCDSHGKCAKYCTYSLIEQDDKYLIVPMEIVDKGEVHFYNLPIWKERHLSFLSSHVKIEEVITDASTSVKKLLCKN